MVLRANSITYQNHRLDVYEKYTGKKGYEHIIGGGSFGCLLKRGVAYSAMFEGEQDTMHQANEFKPVDALLKSAAIYQLANSNKKIIILVGNFFAH